MLKSYFIGLLSAFVSGCAALLLFALICSSGDDPRALVSLFGIGAYILGGVIGSLAAVLLNRDNPLASAVFVSVSYAVILLLISLSCRDELSRPIWQSMLICLAVPAISVTLGAVISTRMGGTSSARKKLRKRITKR